MGDTSEDALVVPVSGTTAQVESAFAVPLVQARLASGRTARIATRDPLVPAALAARVAGVEDIALCVPPAADGRIDDANTGWKGRGVWAANESRGTQLTDGGKKLPSQLAHFQVRPDPLAK